MLVQEVLTDTPPADVIRSAREFFATRFSPYGAFVEEETETHIVLKVEAGELMIGTVAEDGRTLVRGSTSRLHHELSQFLATLAPPEDIKQNLAGPGTSGAG